MNEKNSSGKMHIEIIYTVQCVTHLKLQDITVMSCNKGILQLITEVSLQPQSI